MGFMLGLLVGIGIIGAIIVPIFLWCLSRAYELGYRDKEEEDSKWLKIFRRQ